ncbi:MAG: triose-phosphate isomerase [Candidatus Niyogibacteria bacterium]|nr:triose-phosphate isomerase [Candidatus Niyogibacteria bacterium]
MRKIIIANWKLNPATLAAAQLLARRIEKVLALISSKRLGRSKKAEMVIAPPFPFLLEVGRILRRSSLGAQDVFWEEKGAYTGAVSPLMLRSLGVRYVIVGHSERRDFAHETDAEINGKIRSALAKGFFVVLCVGEKDRKKENFERFVKQELLLDFQGIPKKYSKKIIIAYEPIWAIGTGKTVRSSDLYEMVMYIRRVLFDIFGKKAAHSIPVLYGGSVNAKNANIFLEVDGVNGLLVGGASLDPEEFLGIVKSVSGV